jgi:hypothetical protein
MCRVVLIMTFLLVTAGYLPAPIQEIQESPTPAAKEPTKAKRKQTRDSEGTGKTPSPSAKNQPTPVAPRFPGTWSGRLTVTGVLLVAQDNTFVISPLENSVQWTNGSATSNHTAVVVGNSISWKGGSFSEINCKVTMLGNGQTADVRITSPWGSASGTVRRQ